MNLWNARRGGKVFEGRCFGRNRNGTAAGEMDGGGRRGSKELNWALVNSEMATLADRYWSA